MSFDGVTYQRKRDGARLSRQLATVRQVMGDGGWWRLSALAQLCATSTASVSARIRDLRKAKFGGYTVERRYVANGVWEYRLSRACKSCGRSLPAVPHVFSGEHVCADCNHLVVNAVRGALSNLMERIA